MFVNFALTVHMGLLSVLTVKQWFYGRVVTEGVSAALCNQSRLCFEFGFQRGEVSGVNCN